MKPENVTWAFVAAFADELARWGIRDVCVCPGSRSTPLAMVLEAHPDIRVWMHLDERSAAFFALGMARLRRKPVAVLSTSGTAAANFFPAVVEARYGRVPLVVLTADRPPELRDVGANQTIDQLQLFGHHVKWFVEVGLPESGAGALRHVRTLACRAAATAASAPAGAVHLNFPFREPLVPLPTDESPEIGRIARDEGRPYTEALTGSAGLDPPGVERLAAELAGVRGGLILCGPQDDPALAEAVVRLARSLGFPVLADPLSQVRCGVHDRSLLIDAYDAFLRGEGTHQGTQRVPAYTARLAPDLVLRFGAAPTSRPLLLYLERHGDARQIVVDGGAGWNDPTLRAAAMVHAEPGRLCESLAGALEDHAIPAETMEWQREWLRVDHLAREAVAAALRALDEPFEGKVFAELADLLPEGAVLYAGNSMPVRDLDTFFPSRGRTVRFLANRGASGIDGVVSSALGASAASSAPLVLVIGDLSFYHDLNGLLAARLHHLDATIILLNNDGGGIFSFLPQAAHPEHFETLFGTPHGLDFRPAVEMYGGSFERVTTWEAFGRALRRPARGLRVIEVPTERRRNVELHRAVWQAVSRALEPQSVG